MRPRNLDLDLVRTFVTVVDTGSVTRAARQLSYSQSTVSMQLRRLEEQTGRKLVNRLGRGIAPSGEGESFLVHARRLLALNDQALTDLQVRPVTGAVRFGIATDYTFMLPAVLGRFAQLYPLVELEVHNRFSVELVDEIRDGTLDIALTTRQRNSPGGRILRHEQLVWVTGRSRQPVIDDPVPLALYPAEKDIFREIATAALERAGRPWRVIYTAESLGGLLPALTTGLAISAITRSMLTADLKPVDPASALPELPSVEIALHHASTRASEPIQRLTTLIEDELARTPPSES